MSNLEKRSSLQKIIMLSRKAIEKLDEMTYYQNMIDTSGEVNVEHFKELLAASTEEFNSLNERIHELNVLLVF